MAASKATVTLPFLILASLMCFTGHAYEQSSDIINKLIAVHATPCCRGALLITQDTEKAKNIAHTIAQKTESAYIETSAQEMNYSFETGMTDIVERIFSKAHKDALQSKSGKAIIFLAHLDLITRDGKRMPVYCDDLGRCFYQCVLNKLLEGIVNGKRMITIIASANDISKIEKVLTRAGRISTLINL